MKRVLAGVAAFAVLAVAVPAQAAAGDPVKALQGRLATGKGVTFTDTTSYVDLSGKTAFLRREGVLQFGKPVKGGMGVIVASDIRATYTPRKGGIFNTLNTLLHDERTITVGKVSYNKGGALNGDVPSGKPWLRYGKPLPGGISGLYSQMVNPAEPATLQALIKSGTKSGRTVKGHISRAELWRVSPWYRASAMSKSEDRALAFELTLGPDNLPQRPSPRTPPRSTG
ncbi:hypothetical protein ACFFV7_52795 [Nonomuraea spiralis]|uniref:Uncharacterized protein n=1 Tax=Nonomuraea spiralis TaxID=46182 RepID=A0ABV5IZE3_9ACTN|nr:hypothetical protein [Nonomuraea spiralis]GGT18961.1 hypothetical protein GCM10010176_074280 [Nonomuraea spiralis]